MKLSFVIDGTNFDMAGEASSEVKRTLVQLGVPPKIVKRVVIAMYEAEINAFIHGGGGEAYVDIDEEMVDIIIRDRGKGIDNLDLAMQEGWTTADERVIRMGFGAGMGLPNIKKNADHLEIETARGEGTTVKISVSLTSGKGEQI